MGTISPTELHQIRLGLGMAQRELARRLGVAKSTISRWEAGVHPVDPVSERLILILAETRELTGEEAAKQ